MLIFNGQVIAGGGTIVLSMTRAEYEANKAVLDTADVWIDLTDEPDQVATADQIAYSVDGVQKSMGYIGDIATKAVAKVEPTDTALYLHEVGEYFINKDGNACKVDIQIPVNGTITLGANCHVLPKGVANDINSKLGQILWTNPSPTTPFATQTIPLDLSHYKAVALVCTQGTGLLIVGGGSVSISGNYGTTFANVRVRYDSSATTTGVTIGPGGDANGTPNDGLMIPTMIIGLC